VAHLVLSRLARQDLEDLWLHIASNGINTADRVLAAVEHRMRVLTQYPEMAPLRPDIAPDVRGLVVERWLVLYRIEGGVVQVGRVVDGARDLTRLDWPAPM
jgi:toxin ParE1/3/4